jgi:hypothetical protein
MSTLAVITASYAPDAAVFDDLHRSVLQYTDAVHQVIVPSRDADHFGRYAGPRCRIWTAADLLPGRFVPIPRVNGWLNLRRPFPPVRGWIMQQVLKFAATARSEADVVLLADSDVALIAPTTAEDFTSAGRTRFYRSPGAIAENLPRHADWHRTSCALLGVPERPLPLPDYISAFNAWSPSVVRGLLARIEQTTGRDWITAVSSRLTVSEFILYGVYVDQVLGELAPVQPVTSMLCHSYWDTAPLDRRAASDFVDRVGADDLAVMISAKSHTPLSVRRQALHQASALRS